MAIRARLGVLQVGQARAGPTVEILQFQAHARGMP